MQKYRYLQNGEDRVNIKGEWVSSYTADKEKKVRYWTRSYCVWNGVVVRTRDGSAQQRKHPQYSGCENHFSNFQEFARWCQTEPNYLSREVNGKFWQLDKDIIIPFNKVYSPTTCCFVPNEINGLLTWRTGDRGDLPLGVVADYGRGNCDVVYRAYCNVDGKQTQLGRRKDPMEAHELWQKAKIEEIHKKICKYELPAKVVEGLKLHAELIRQDMLSNLETVR